MSAIKKFFQKKKMDFKFKKYGEGHKLDEPAQRPPPIHRPIPQPGTSSQPSISPRGDAAVSEEKKRAAAAALARMEQKEKQSKQDENIMSMKARMRREMEAEKKATEKMISQAQAMQGPVEIEKDHSPVIRHVLYTCPDIGPAVLPKDEIDAYIHEFLLTQLAEEPEMSSAVMIQTLNKDKEKVKICVETLIKYLDNITNNPGEEKYRKIRMSNKAFKERVSQLNGTDEFLQACGFEIKQLPFEDKEENFYVMSGEIAENVERLNGIKEVLSAAEPIQCQLDRALKVFHQSSGSSKFDIPEEFYAINPEELKKEQQRRQEAVEKLGMLRTKAMRERDEMKELRKYRFTLVRVRLPDGILIQGIFKANEKLSCLYDFIRSSLENDWMPFILQTSNGSKLTEETKTMAELGLCPAVVLHFVWDESVMKDVHAAQGGGATSSILKPDIMAQIQSL
ncbi:UBX domain-containing protein 6-like [Mytilus trossulus]|uniref:UBX domain-containing protein 6-like n=1 Tax=Mytilus trossulus TaxID=6551 RepID=UPI003006BDE4